MPDAIATARKDTERQTQQCGGDESTSAQQRGIHRAAHHERRDRLLELERSAEIEAHRATQPFSVPDRQRTIEPGGRAFGVGAQIGAGTEAGEVVAWNDVHQHERC